MMKLILSMFGMIWLLPANTAVAATAAFAQATNGRVPEPGVLALFGLGLAALGTLRRSRTATAATG